MQSCPNNYRSFPDGTLISMTGSRPSRPWSSPAGPATCRAPSTRRPLRFTTSFCPRRISTWCPLSSQPPASPVRSSAASNLTLSGAGFVSGSFYTYYRANKAVSPTQATVELNAGDLASAGSQLLQVSNFTPSGCDALAFTQVLVKNGQGTARLRIATGRPPARSPSPTRSPPA